MPVENRIVKVQKRNRSLVRFDPERIQNAILRAGQAVGGFHQDHVPGINDRVFPPGSNDDDVAQFLTDAVLLCLNSDPHHLIVNFPPTIEAIQDEVLHVLRSYGLQQTADAYACYRWSRHWLREGDVSKDQFIGNGLNTARFQASLAWNQEHGCHTQAGLNEIVREGNLGNLTEAAIARYESELEQLTSKLIERLDKGSQLRLVWIAGPTSSGKTTTAVKLTQKLEQDGIQFQMLNLDDYFWPLVEHPTDWINDRNYETPEALDIQLINEHLRKLLEGEEIEKPVFSFKEGRRVGCKRLRLKKDQVLLLDCLHGLYPPLTEGIDRNAEFRIFIDACNALYEGDGSSKRLVPDCDVRMLRRMLRDSRHRNASPILTLLHWHYVRAGELFSILPLEGRADAIINGGFPFDLTAMQPLLCGVEGVLPSDSDLMEYSGFQDAQIRMQRIQRILKNVDGLSQDALEDQKLIPGDAVIREFIGGSTIKIPHNE